MNKDTDNRNMIYFLIVSMALLAFYQFFVFGPQQKKREAAQAVAAASASSSAAASLPMGGVSTALTREQALAASPRVIINTPSLKGSISLKGALIDDLYLIKYDQTVDKKNDPVELLTPAGAKNAYYVQSAYFAQNVPGMPDNNTVWTQTGGSVLSPGQPVVLSYVNGTGLTFTRTLSIDANYMITADDAVTNTGSTPVSFQPFSVVMRSGMPEHAGKEAVVHEGAIATYSKIMDKPKPGDYRTASLKYKDMAKPKGGKALESQDSIGGWYGITDKYWMAAVIPSQAQAVSYTAKAIVTDGVPVFRSGYVDAPVTLAAGTTWKSQSHVFAGAKQNTQLQIYEDSLHIPRFHWAVDWGMLSVITYPMYWLLDKLYSLIGNFGLAILSLTVIVKLVFYPLAHKSYESMTKMKQVQERLKPKLDAIKKRYEGDAQKTQEATMALYQEEKVNPMAGLGGCLPMLLQLPVFWGLYKVLMLAIEMRHAPFFGWINDLSARDSTTIFNLFGALPYDPATVPMIGTMLNGPLHIGVIAILYGCSMWLSQQMTPMTGVDPMQKKMMSFMPIMLTFFMTQVAVGLIIYWIWSNILTILQQYSIMHRLKVSNPIDTGFQKLNALMNKGKKAA
ncbi:membrane protein insertase YidC [Asticcacaulis sp.]|uniref:membrane protein insertase YidC n=1 Tax=Asticcacaulis sp. TaxID=1872648 RepID=UPI002B5C2E02|nr:membrane protein insertase YidC [Asticcacaulis sp.]HTM82772.1 membrane protein insertase YidC [Asticcacaulis sp.]